MIYYHYSSSSSTSTIRNNLATRLQRCAACYHSVRNQPYPMSQVAVQKSALINEPSRVIYTLSPGILVHIGPDFQTALDGLVFNILNTYRAVGHEARHFATTYSFSTIAIFLDFFPPSDTTDVQVRFIRLRLRNNELAGQAFVDDQLIKRITSQLQSIRNRQPEHPTPLICYEGWRGHGPKDRPIYGKMVQAGRSVKAWRAFKDSMRQPTPKRQSQDRNPTISH